MTKEEAKSIIEQYKNKTAYFDGVIKLDNMFQFLKNDAGFGVAEANVIIAALVSVGAKFIG